MCLAPVFCRSASTAYDSDPAIAAHRSQLALPIAISRSPSSEGDEFAHRHWLTEAQPDTPATRPATSIITTAADSRDDPILRRRIGLSGVGISANTSTTTVVSVQISTPQGLGAKPSACPARLKCVGMGSGSLRYSSPVSSHRPPLRAIEIGWRCRVAVSFGCDGEACGDAKSSTTVVRSAAMEASVQIGRQDGSMFRKRAAVGDRRGSRPNGSSKLEQKRDDGAALAGIFGKAHGSRDDEGQPPRHQSWLRFPQREGEPSSDHVKMAQPVHSTSSPVVGTRDEALHAAVGIL